MMILAISLAAPALLIWAIFAIVGMTAAIVIASLPFILAGHILQWMFG